MEKVESTKSAAKRERLRVLVADDDELIIGEALGALAVPVAPGESKPGKGEPRPEPGIEFDVVICRRGEEAIRTIRDAAGGNDPVAVAFLDYHMPPGISGLTAAEQIRVHDSEVEIVIVGAPEEISTKDLGRTSGPLHRILFAPTPARALEWRQTALVLGQKWRTQRAHQAQARKWNAMLRERETELRAYRSGLTAEIAKHARTNLELRDTQEHYNRLTQVTREGVIVYHQGKIVDANAVAESLFGFRGGEMIGRDFFDLWPLDAHAPIQQRMETENSATNPEIGVRKDGSRFNAEIVITAFMYRNRSMYLAVVQDVTERETAQQAVRETEERYQGVFEAAGEGIGILDLKGILQDANAAYADMLGFSRADLVGKPMSAFVRRGDEPFTPAFLSEIRTSKSRTPVRLEAVFLRKNGDPVDVEVALMPLTFAKRSALIGIFRDVTERKKAERALRESEMRYRMLADNATDIIWTMDMDLRFTHVSPAVTRVFGYTVAEALELPMTNLMRPEDVEIARNVLRNAVQTSHDGVAGSAPAVLELRNVHKSGRTIWTETTIDYIRDEAGTPTGIIGATRDVTRRKEAEAEKETLQAQLRQALKMEAIGRLAGGVAHDFNNMLTGILVNAQIMIGALDVGHPLRLEAQEIKRAAERAADLTKQLLAFGRKQIISPKALNLNEMIQMSQKMIGRIIGEDIERIYDLGETLWSIHADPVQIDQVLVNLSVNARDAMPQGGTLRFVTRNCHLDRLFCRAHPGCTPGDYVLIQVSDNGHGMDEETQKLIFEPFFTTKEKGQGTGLGLATVFGVVKQNDGFIYVDSAPGQGATFRLYFPRLAAEAQTSVPAEPAAVRGGRERVMVVDDDEMIRDVTARVLRTSGYAVESATSGAAAIRMCREGGSAPELLITDIVMPGMSGRELYDRLREIVPSVRVLFISGYPEDAIAGRGLLDIRTNYLQKPFSIERLSQLVREILDAPAASSP